jgi:hypothetical protein
MKLSKGDIFHTDSHGDVMFMGWDNCMGQVTAEFKSLTYQNSIVHWTAQQLREKGIYPAEYDK